MTDIPSRWRVDESGQESSHAGNGKELPEYIRNQSTPTTQTYTGYVSPDETTLITVAKLNLHSSENTGLFIYLYEHIAGTDRSPFWLFSAGDNADRARRVARQLVVARDETSYTHGNLEFIPDLRDRVPGLSVHTEYAEDNYTDENVQENNTPVNLPDPTGHPLEVYLSGYAVGTQFGEPTPQLSCYEPNCYMKIAGYDQSGWELNSTLYLGKSDQGVFLPFEWRCSEHSADSLESFISEIDDTLEVKDAEALINERVEELKEGDAFDEIEVDDVSTSVRSKNGAEELKQHEQARQELEEEGVLNERSESERGKLATRYVGLLGRDIIRYYLVRCDIDSVNFGDHWQDISYIRNPVVVDEYQYA